MTSITIPNTVTTIDSAAFKDCSKLTSIVLPDSITTIGANVFSGCSELTDIVLPFVGFSTNQCQYPFGYLFGTSSYTDGVENEQIYYTSSGSISRARYYIPSSLKSVSGTSHNGNKYFFYKCSWRKKGKGNCTKQTVRKDDLENIVLDMAMDLFTNKVDLDIIADEIMRVREESAKEHC